ncbi:sulfatase [Natronohydrobacter thiooxidans]|uniref:sulfatase n=1 Tax=Natronohydrobacter thiooxidans TaxID=87172 RepID=UPI0008FF5F25|nr:sulfatase [Natronohydrobacter thiooxidans]
MRTVFVVFDSLNAAALAPYGAKEVHTPNFARLAERAVTFDSHFVGSLPCMPARRDLHTGRLNFMHRSWGPLEPFDNSLPRLLSAEGVYSHIVTDHMHYFEEGGNGYVQAFDTWEFVRGQENDPWRAEVEPPLERYRSDFDQAHYDIPAALPATRGKMSRWEWKKLCHAVNREAIRDEKDYPTVKCFDHALDFLARNRGAGDWFLQVEAFDPHEPFLAPERFKAMYPTDWSGGILDWPRYEKADGDAAARAEIRSNYAALVSMCDDQLGRLLDTFDAHDLWRDTCLIVTTDHGFLLSEHEWWGKNRMPYFTEISRIPLMIWHPDSGQAGGSRCDALTQTPDLMPTILDLHNVSVPSGVLAQSLLPVLQAVNSPRESVIFGQFGGPVAVTDGRYLLFRYPQNVSTEGLNEYTLMPIHMSSAFTPDELGLATLAPPFGFTNGLQVLRIPSRPEAVRPPGLHDAFDVGIRTELFDLEYDPDQTRALDDPEVEARLLASACRHLLAHETPGEVYAHYGLNTYRETVEERT